MSRRICPECEGLGSLDRPPSYAELRQLGFQFDGLEPCPECGGRGFYSPRSRRPRVQMPARRTSRAEAAQALDTAGSARRTLAGLERGVGFWRMPGGSDFVLTCWRNNLDRARSLRQGADR